VTLTTKEGIEEDAEEDDWFRLCHREFIADLFSHWSGSPSVGVGIFVTSATKKRPETAEICPFFVADVTAMPTSIDETPASDMIHSKLHAEHTGTFTQPTRFRSKSAHAEREMCGETVLRAVEINGL
jgi:hypothetical protein